MMNVELQIFSGRSNPIWQIDEGLLLKLISKLVNDEKFEVLNKLGYSGFSIWNEKLKIFVYRNFVIKNEEFFKDENCEIERILIESAEPIVPKEILEKIKRKVMTE